MNKYLETEKSDKIKLMDIFKIENLNVKFKSSVNTTEAIHDVSFSVAEGECLGIIGESGSGKSTVAKAVMGLLPDSAAVSYNERIPDGKLNMAMIFQNPMTCLNPSLTVGRQLLETVLLHSKYGRNKAKEEMMRLIDTVGIRNPDKYLKKYPFELSGGMQQRVVTAIALACKPKLLIADEPTTALDMIVQKQILDLLKDIMNETKISIIIITHDLGVATNLCDRLLIMKDGIIVEEGITEKILHEPQNSYTVELLNNATFSMSNYRDNRASDKILKFDSVQKIYDSQNISGSKKKTEAIQYISFEVHKGECFGIVGESGSGKTTIARLTAGIEIPTKGIISFKDKPVSSCCSTGVHDIQMIFQNSYNSFHPNFNVKQILEESLIYRKKYNKHEFEYKICEMLELVGLEPAVLSKFPKQLSGGEQQRIAIGRALIGCPELLICDEAISSLDITIQTQILLLLKRIQKKKQLSCLFISHDLNAVRYIAQRTGVIYSGLLIECGNTKEIFEEPWHPYTKQLLKAALPPDIPRSKNLKHIPLKDELYIEKQGCPYHSSCGYSLDICKTKCPGNYHFDKREVSCFLYSEEHTGKRSPGYIMGVQI